MNLMLLLDLLMRDVLNICLVATPDLDVVWMALMWLLDENLKGVLLQLVIKLCKLFCK